LRRNASELPRNPSCSSETPSSNRMYRVTLRRQSSPNPGAGPSPKARSSLSIELKSSSGDRCGFGILYCRCETAAPPLAGQRPNQMLVRRHPIAFRTAPEMENQSRAGALLRDPKKKKNRPRLIARPNQGRPARRAPFGFEQNAQGGETTTRKPFAPPGREGR